MRADVLLRELCDPTFALVREHLVGFFEGQPHAAADLNAHVFGDIADPAATIAKEIEGDDFEDAFAPAPRACVDVTDIGEFGDAVGFEAGLFANLAFGGFFGLFPFIDSPLGKRQHTRFLANWRRWIVAIVIDRVGLDYSDMPFPADTSQHDATGGNFSDRLCLGGHARKPEFRVKLYVRRVRSRAQRCAAVEKTEESKHRAISDRAIEPSEMWSFNRSVARSPDGTISEVSLAPILYYTDHHHFPLPDGHRFPVAKYRLIRELLQATGLFDLRPAPLAEPSQVELAHDSDYVRQFVEGTLPREMMRRIGFPWSEGLVRRTLASVGATLAASEQALTTGFGGTLAGGTHHAFRSEGSGYCVFNDIAVAIESLRKEGKASRFAVVDLDVHQGDGTAQIFENDPNVLTFSMHGGKNFPFRKQKSRIDVELEDGTGDEVYLEKLVSALPTVLEFGPEFVFYQSGVDPLDSDRLGRLAVTMEGLRERDRMVFELARRGGWPVVITLGGGYSDPISRTAEAHAQTFQTAVAVFNPPANLKPSQDRLAAKD